MEDSGASSLMQAMLAVGYLEEEFERLRRLLVELDAEMIKVGKHRLTQPILLMGGWALLMGEWGIQWGMKGSRWENNWVGVEGWGPPPLLLLAFGHRPAALPSPSIFWPAALSCPPGRVFQPPLLLAHAAAAHSFSRSLPLRPLIHPSLFARCFFNVPWALRRPSLLLWNANSSSLS